MEQNYTWAKEVRRCLVLNKTHYRNNVRKFSLPFTIVGRNPKKNRGGIILYKVSDINEYLERKGKNTLY